MLDQTLPEHRLISVQQLIVDIENLCNSKVASSPNKVWILMQWGENKYTGQVSALSIQQTLFNGAGEPIQARVNITLTDTTAYPVAKKGSGLTIPSLPVLENTKLTSLLALVGLSASLAVGPSLSSGMEYIQVAADNDLDSLNDVPTGDTLIVGS